MSTIILFIIALLVLVVGHELGHFIAAKSFGITVEEFGIGYPPRAKKLFRWKGTLFTLNWLPFGGFVKIFGEEGHESPSSFSHQALWKRLVVIVAGVTANVILAIVLYAMSFSVGFLGNPSDFPVVSSVGPTQVLLTDVHSGTPASEVGLRAGDTVLSLTVNGDSFVPKDVSDFSHYIQNHDTSTVTMRVLRGGREVAMDVVPRKAEGAASASIGVTITEAARIRLPFLASVRLGMITTFQEFGAIFLALGSLVTGGLANVAGPVGIAGIAGVAYSFGLGSFLSFMALISVNLAVINLLPFPALDGGRFILECFSKEGVSRIPDAVIGAVNRLGFLLLIVIMVYVTFKDIVRLG
jgi:regulator of sigma E protease